MSKSLAALLIASLWLGSARPAPADPFDALLGMYAFNWVVDPTTVKCAAIDKKMLASLRSKDFTCNLKFETNTSSQNPAMMCTKTGDKVEYLIFKTKKQCEEERESQANNE